MPLFQCDNCGCVENTALCNYWSAEMEAMTERKCSGCDPQIGQWHGKFPKRHAEGMLKSPLGHLYSDKEAEELQQPGRYLHNIELKRVART